MRTTLNRIGFMITIGLTACQSISLSPNLTSPTGAPALSPSSAPTVKQWQVSTLAGNGQLGFQDGPGQSARFYHPTGVTTDATGKIYIADRFNQRIRQMDDNGQVSTISGQEKNGFLNGSWAEALFNLPFALAIGGTKQIYVADTNNHAIRVIQPDQKVTTLAGSGDPGSDDGKTPTLNWPGGMALDTQGHLYIADRLNQKIRYLKTDGTSVAVPLVPAANEPPLNEPVGVARDSEGMLYIADSLNHRIRKLDPATGRLSTLAGDGVAGWQDGPAAKSRLNTPFGLTLDDTGHLYVVDRGNHCIRAIEIKTGVVTTIAGDGSGGFKNGVGNQAQFKVPFGIAFKAPNMLVVADYGNHAIRQLKREP